MMLALSFLLLQSASVSFDQGHDATGIPFELNSDKIYVSVAIGKSSPRSFVLDSGSPSTVLDMGLAKSLRLPMASEGLTGGAGEAQRAVAGIEVDNLSLRGLSYRPASPLAIDLDPVMKSVEGRHIDGLLGGDLFAQTVVEIDYRKNQLAFHDPAHYHHTGKGFTVPIKLGSGWMLADATFVSAEGEKLSGTFIIDTGARLAVTLNTPFVNEHHLVNASTPRMVVGSGIGGKVEHGVGRLRWFQIGNLRVDHPTASFSQDRNGIFASGAIQGLIGAEILRRYRVTVDYPEHKLYLDPAGAPEPYDFDASGMFVIATGDDLKSFEVLAVASGSAAEEAGIREGDAILSINGKPAMAFSLELIRRLTRNPGGRVVMEISHAGTLKSVEVRLRRLV